MNKIKSFIFLFFVFLFSMNLILFGGYAYFSIRIIIEFYNKYGEINSNINYLLVDFFYKIFSVGIEKKVIISSLVFSILILPLSEESK